jgi:ribosomal protein S18 acetylase RimI-like enzyme
VSEVAQRVLVRAVSPDDDELVAACGALVADVYGGEELLEDEDGYLPVLRDAMTRAREAVLLAATSGEELLGTATYARAGSPWAELAGPGEAEMRMLAVAAAARGRGVGRLLGLACLDQAREEGCTRFVLSSGPRMTAAHRMYEGMGFVRTPARDWSPVPGVDLVTYALDL